MKVLFTLMDTFDQLLHVLQPFRSGVEFYGLEDCFDTLRDYLPIPREQLGNLGLAEPDCIVS